MTLAASWDLQKAIHASLVADPTLSASVSGRIFDRPPQDAAFPFVSLGDTDVEPDRAGSDGAAIHRLAFSVWSRARGRRETKEIMSAIDQTLQDASLTLADHVLVTLQLERASVSYAVEAEALRGRLIFRAYTEPTT